MVFGRPDLTRKKYINFPLTRQGSATAKRHGNSNLTAVLQYYETRDFLSALHTQAGLVAVVAPPKIKLYAQHNDVQSKLLSPRGSPEKGCSEAKMLITGTAKSAHVDLTSLTKRLHPAPPNPRPVESARKRNVKAEERFAQHFYSDGCKREAATAKYLDRQYLGRTKTPRVAPVKIEKIVERLEDNALLAKEHLQQRLRERYLKDPTHTPSYLSFLDGQSKRTEKENPFSRGRSRI